MRTGFHPSIVAALLIPTSVLVLNSCGQMTTRSTTTSVSQDLSGLNYVNSTTNSTTTTSSGSGVTNATSGSGPTISSSLANGGLYTVALKNTLTLDAPFETDSTITYQWYKNGSKLGGTQQTKSEIVIDSMTSTDYGTYYVVATNSVGTVTSSPFVVQPVLALVTLGSKDCNGGQCENDALTAEHICTTKFGDQAVISPQYGYGSSGIKWTNYYCDWTSNNTWSCASWTVSQTAANVMGYVYCEE